MNAMVLKIWYVFFGAVAILLHFGCSSIQPAPEVVVEPPVVVEFKETDLRWLLLLPQHHPSSQPSSPIVLKPKYFNHTITTPGETLMAVARWYTGNANNWRHLVQVNKDLDPQRMKIGTTIIIPEQILITREPMPLNLKPVQHSQKSPLVTVQTSNHASTPQLYGPIENSWSPENEKNTGLPRSLQRLDESN